MELKLIRIHCSAALLGCSINPRSEIFPRNLSKHSSVQMGGVFSSKKKGSKISDEDKAVLTLKVQRRKLAAERKRVGLPPANMRC